MSELNSTHLDEVEGLWIPPEFREFSAQIVLRTPRATIQHFERDGGHLDPYYGMIDESHFGTEEELYDVRNPDLIPDKVSIKPQGEDPVVLTVDLAPEIRADGGNETSGRERFDEWGVYLVGDSPLKALPLALDNGEGDKNLLVEAVADRLTHDELDDLINELIRESNRRYEAKEHDPARLGELAKLHGRACADCGRNAPVFGPINFDGEQLKNGDYCCRTCAVDRGAVERRERELHTDSDRPGVSQ